MLAQDGDGTDWTADADGRAEVDGTTRAEERSDAIREDPIAFGELARAVLAAVAEEDQGAADALIAMLDRRDPNDPGALTAFAERLLETARPEPVRIGLPAAGLREHSVGSRTAAPRRSATAVRAAAPSRSRAGVQAVLSACRSRIGAVRPKFWVPAAAAGLALVAAAVLVPGDAPSQADAARAGLDTPPATPAASTIDEVAAATAAAASAPDAAAGTAAEDTAAGVLETPSATASPSEDGATAPDPVSALLAMRQDAIGATVIDDYGDVVLIAVETADGSEEVLIERTAAGWRLRDTLPRE